MGSCLVRSGFLVTVGVALAGGCGGNGGKHGVECETPGELGRCVCSGALDGTRTCQEDGYWGECDCSTPYVADGTGGENTGGTTVGTGGDQTGGIGGTANAIGGTSAGGAAPAAGGASTGGVETGVGGAVVGAGGASAGGTPSAIGGTSPAAGGATGASGGESAGGTPAALGGASSGGAVGTTGGSAGAAGVPVGVGGSAGTPGEGGTTATGGADGRGGATAGDTVCGTAPEDQATTLSCPEGQVIDSVVFASYGNPTGECGSFAIGDCHAAESETLVASLCVGRRSCTVPASNSTFGDPCNSSVKSVAVELACVVGEPTVVGEPFKGLANSPAGEMAALGATWCYNWGTSPQVSDCADPLFVPMIWGDGDVAAAIQQIGNAGYTTVLGFNEPNKSDQANMTVQRAIELWPDMTSNPNIRVSSPAVSDDGRAWLQDFMTQAQANGLRVDFIAMHWYGWNAGSCTAGSLEGAINWAQQWGLPVWITEFGCMGSSNPDEQTLLDFFPAAVAMIAGHPLVERYAWYPWNDYNHLYLDGAITPLGELYAAAPQYR